MKLDQEVYIFSNQCIIRSRRLITTTALQTTGSGNLPPKLESKSRDHLSFIVKQESPSRPVGPSRPTFPQMIYFIIYAYMCIFAVCRIYAYMHARVCFYVYMCVCVWWFVLSMVFSVFIQLFCYGLHAQWYVYRCIIVSSEFAHQILDSNTWTYKVCFHFLPLEVLVLLTDPIKIRYQLYR